MAEDIDEAELIGEAILSHARELRVALPGRIESYDASKQRASIRLQLSYYVPTTDGGQLARDHAIIQNVPICFPQGGGYFCAFPMAKDDPVMVVFNDVPIGAWLANGQPCEPGVDDMHGLGGAVAFPAGPQPSKTPLQSAGGSNMRLGKDGTDDAQIELTPTEVRLGVGATEAIAIASKVKSDMSALAGVFSAWVVSPQDGGAALKTALMTLIGNPWPAASYGASNAKAKP